MPVNSKKFLRKLISCIVLVVAFTTLLQAQAKNKGHVIQIIFTSDAHYGISRKIFRGQADVSGHQVNAAMIEKINTVPFMQIPTDSGLNAGKTVGNIDYVIEGGDIANRMEIPNQSAARSWAQFDSDYIRGIHLKGQNNKPAKLLIIPGNHDISNAIGFYKPMNPLTDPTCLVNIYNLMLKPAVPLTNNTYNYAENKINYSRNIGHIHFMFLTLWPDSLERTWMEKDLAKISTTTPVIIFSHDQPESEAKHFTNPNPGQTLNADDKFENLLSEMYKDSTHINSEADNTKSEQLGLVQFLKKHPNIKAYFHGNANFNEFYLYRGPYHEVTLNVFRVDSPMKGRISSLDESKLSFQLITIDTKNYKMTVRECLWNSDPSHPEKPLQWGISKTISIL